MMKFHMFLFAVLIFIGLLVIEQLGWQHLVTEFIFGR